MPADGASPLPAALRGALGQKGFADLESVCPEPPFLHGQKAGGQAGHRTRRLHGGARSSCRQKGESYSAAANSCLDPSQSPETGGGCLQSAGGVAGKGALRCGTPALNALVCRSTSKPGNEALLGAGPGSACGVRLGLGLGLAWG